VTAWTDGGGKVPASRHPLVGIAAVMERHIQLAQTFAKSPSRLIRHAVIDGLPGFVTVEGGGVMQTTALQMEGEKIAAIYITRNPDKLLHMKEARSAIDRA
jgi:RNA polymerase sigma-70 factor (ECF subfamily)